MGFVGVPEFEGYLLLIWGNLSFEIFLSFSPFAVPLSCKLTFFILSSRFSISYVFHLFLCTFWVVFTDVFQFTNFLSTLSIWLCNAFLSFWLWFIYTNLIFGSSFSFKNVSDYFWSISCSLIFDCLFYSCKFTYVLYPVILIPVVFSEIKISF